MFLEAYATGAAVFVNSFRCQLSEDKAFFALLTDEAFAVSDERGRAALRRRRRAVDAPGGGAPDAVRTAREVDLVPFVVAQRESLVLKPAHGYGGQSVLVGDETDAARRGRRR